MRPTRLVKPEDGELAQHLRAIERGEKELPKSDAKRQHFVAQFHLGEFTKPPRDDRARVIQLDIKTGRPDPVKPESAASRRRFYTIEDQEGEAEQLDRVVPGSRRVVRRAGVAAARRGSPRVRRR